MSFCLAQDLFAWGYNGHATVTRVASEIIAKNDKRPSSFMHFIKRNSGTLEHLSNIPDTYWQGRDDAKRFNERSNHYLNSEVLVGDKKYRKLPKTKKSYLKLIKNYCLKHQAECVDNPKRNTLVGVGRVVFRIDQIMTELTKKLRLMHKKKNKDIGTDILVLMGVLSHYVGDLANPLHTTLDYDGWYRDQGGIHKFFEVKVVETYGLSFDQQIYELAINNNVVATIPFIHKKSSIEVVNWLVENSFQQLEQLFKIDRDCSLVKPSQQSSIRIPAKRKRPESCTQAYRQFIAKQMSIGSSVLSHLWMKAYKDSGRPESL